MPKLVSIVIPCRNEESYIETCLRSLLDNGYPIEFLELLVIDAMSSDSTARIVDELSTSFSQIKRIPNPNIKTPFGLNLGVHNARGEYIMIASAHACFDKNYIATLLAKLENKMADVAGGVMRTNVKNETKTSLAIQQILAHPSGVGNALFRTGIEQDTYVDTVPFGLYKSELLVQNKGYNERLIRNHDIELSKRLLASGAKILLTPDAQCVYYCRETFSAMSNNNFENGQWNLLTLAITRDLSSLSLRHLIPLIFVLSVILPLLFLPFSFLFIVLSAAALLAHLIFVVFNALSMPREKTSYLHLVCALMILHWSYGLGSLKGAFLAVPVLFRKKI